MTKHIELKRFNQGTALTTGTLRGGQSLLDRCVVGGHQNPPCVALNAGTARLRPVSGCKPQKNPTVIRKGTSKNCCQYRSRAAPE
jgi:hypothetical protein